MPRAGLVAAAVWLMGCSGGSGRDGRQLSATLTDSAGVRVVVLDQSPSDVSRGGAPADTLRPTLDIASSPETFDAVYDVTSTVDGRIAVLDLERQGVFTFTPEGRPLARIGRAGDGPGELRAPVAVTALGDRLAVLQARPSNTLLVFDQLGRVAASLSLERPGDWVRMVSRAPVLPVEVPTRARAVSEDFTRRLDASGDTALVVQQQPGEDPAVASAFRPEAALLRYDARLRLLDTLARVPGVPVLPGRAPAPGVEIQSVTPLFFARSVWALGEGWVAFGHGAATELTVRSTAGASLMHIRWPRTVPVLVSRGDRLAFARWVAERAERDAGASVRARIAGLSRSERERQIRRYAGITPFADSVPELMAVYAAGSCLWLSGFAPGDYLDGTSLTWIGVDVASGRSWRVMRIPRRDGRVRHMDTVGVYVTYRDSVGLTHLERYAWGPRQCRKPAKPLS